MFQYKPNMFNKLYNEYDMWYEKKKFAYLSEIEALKKVVSKNGKGLEIGVGTGRFAGPLGISVGIDEGKIQRSDFLAIKISNFKKEECKMKKNFFAIGLFLGVYLLFSACVFAHTMWINATEYSPEYHPESGARSKVYFGWGHHYPVDDFLSVEDLQEFSLIYPDGERRKINPESGGFLATEVNFKQAGLYIVSAAKKPGFYTMYVEKEKVHHKIGPKIGLEGVILSHYYEQYAKCLINVGKAEDDSFSKPVGHKLEIVPLENPYKLRGCGGQFLPVKVLFDGKPAKYCKVLATYSGFSTREDFAYATSTDSEGIAKIRLTHWGPWLIKTEMKLPAPDDLKDKCNELSYTATLTFEVP